MAKRCVSCGRELNDDARFCDACGTPQIVQSETQHLQASPPRMGGGAGSSKLRLILGTLVCGFILLIVLMGLNSGVVIQSLIAAAIGCFVCIIFFGPDFARSRIPGAGSVLAVAGYSLAATLVVLILVGSGLPKTPSSQPPDIQSAQPQPVAVVLATATKEPNAAGQLVATKAPSAPIATPTPIPRTATPTSSPTATFTPTASPTVTATPTPDAAALLQRVDAAWAKGTRPIVIFTLEELRRIAPDSGDYRDKLYDAYLNYGIALSEAGDKNGAATQFRKAQDLDPGRNEAAARASALTPTATATPRIVLLDVPRWIGKPGKEFRVEFGDAPYADRVKPGELHAAPSGGEAWTYLWEWAMADTIIDENGRVSGFLVNFERPYPKDYDAALRILNLPTGQQPTTDAPAARRWNNLAGLTVGLTKDAVGRREVALATVWRAR